MNERTEHKTISYQCNKCRKIRRLIIYQDLEKKVEEMGYTEFYDVHQCANNQQTAVICFVDHSLIVRSQISVVATHFGYEAERDLSKAEMKDSGNNIQIPAPKKTASIKIDLDISEIKTRNILGFSINDKLRKSIHKFEKNKEGKSISNVSNLGFIEIAAIISKSTADNIFKKWQKKSSSSKKQFPFADTRMWLKELSNSIETRCLLNDDIYPFIIEYIDQSITEEPTKKCLLKLDLLLDARFTIPKTTTEEIERFSKNGHRMFSNATVLDLVKYKTLLELCLENTTLSIFEIYEKEKGKMKLTEFVTIISDLMDKKFTSAKQLVFI